MNDTLVQLGVGGLFAYIIIKEVLAFLSRRKNDTSGFMELLKDMAGLEREVFRMTSDLHDWHSREDSAGRKLWYTDPTFTKAIDTLAKNVETQTEALRLMIDEIKGMRRELPSRT